MRRPQSDLVYTSDSLSRPAGAERRAGAAERRVTPPAAAGDVRIWLEKKGRNGKPVSIVRGLGLDASALGTLATRLKKLCGTGGSAKDGEIIIQGDHRDRIVTELANQGFRVKLAGG